MLFQLLFKCWRSVITFLFSFFGFLVMGLFKPGFSQKINMNYLVNIEYACCQQAFSHISWQLNNVFAIFF